MPLDPLLDMMRRSLKNLEFIETHASESGPYEVTQLINSFLGALAHPWERLRCELAAITLADAIASGWPQITKELDTDCEPTSLGDLVRLMRNAIAHGNIELLPGSAGQIQALRLWNSDGRGKRSWGIILTVAMMRTCLVRFAAFAELLRSQQTRSSRSA